MRKEGAIIIANAIIWAAVILGSAVRLKGTGLFPDLLPIIAGGAAISNILVGGLLAKPKGGS
jgi:hypothetical protein